MECEGEIVKLTLTEEEKKVVQHGVRRVLANGGQWHAPKLHHPSLAIIAAVAEIDGMIDTEDTQTNGRQWDWWHDFKFNGTRYTLSGSGAHGGHSFHVADEQDEADYD